MAVTLNKGTPVGPVVSVPEPAGTHARRAVILEQSGDAWKAVEAEIGGDHIVVLNAHAVSGQQGPPEAVRTRNGNDVALLPELQTCVCRVFDMPGAVGDQVRSMVSLRLELELPYPVAESTWACEAQMNGHGPSGRVLLIAAATQEIALAEHTLHEWGVRNADVEFAPAALAELALATDVSPGTLAILRVEQTAATLVLVHGRSLCYTRQIRLDAATGAAEDWIPSLAREVNQSLYDYQLRTGNPRPERLTLVSNANAGVLLDALESQLEMPASPLLLPDAFAAPSGVSVDDLLDEYPACLGALLAMHRRARGETSAAPPLQRQKRAARAAGWRGRRGQLIAINAALLVLVLLLGFAVQSVRMSNAEKLIAGSEPIRTGLEKLQEQVEILRFEEKRPRYMLDVLQGMAEVLPPDIKVESLTIDPKGKVALSGTAGSVEAASDAAMTSLRESKMFINPVFHGATKEKDGFGFRITCDLRGGQGGGK